jgi:anti-sigma regulatory factor (Ser/Thr protein kinase)
VAGDQRRFRHEAAIYGSDDELVAIAVPFLRDGVAAGQPTFLGINPGQQRIVLDALGDTAGITPLDTGEHYAHPFTALDLNHRVASGHLAEGAPGVRMLGEVPPLGATTAWDGWLRYEAGVNHVLGPLDIWSVCPYDARRTPDDVLADVERTHTHLASADGAHRANPHYADPAALLAERARHDPDPLEASEPRLVRRDPTPAEARRAVAALAEGTEVDGAAVDRLILAVSELVTNGTMHGRPPVDLRAWATRRRIVVSVTDRGPGPSDPFAGFLPRRGDEAGGLGLWMVNQACSRVAYLPEPDGFTIRVTAGTLPPP